LNSYFDGKPIGEAYSEVDCRVSAELVRRPDISVFLGDRWRQLDLDRILAPYPPDIVIEVLSPTESAMDVRRKVRQYLLGGSQEVWLLDHANGEVVVHTQANVRILAERESVETPLLPGFSLPVADLFVGC
jgi:Uma2 family endonuclease